MTEARKGGESHGFLGWTRHHLPAVTSFALVCIAFPVSAYISALPLDRVLAPGCESACTEVVGSKEWRVWVGTVAVGSAGAALLGVRGVVRLGWLSSTRRGANDGLRRVVGYTFAGLSWVICLGILVWTLVDESNRWSPPMEVRLRVVTGIGLLSAAPWVALTWSCHGAVRALYTDTGYAHATRGVERSVRTDVETDADLAALSGLWDHIVSVALAFATFVAVSVLPAGALRNLWLSAGSGDPAARASDFTSVDVVLFGSLWALFAAIVVLPLVAAWRATTQRVIDAAFPPDATTARDAAALQQRSALQTMFNLDRGILRSPLTVLTLATPLLTAAVAAFVPEVAS